MVREASRDSGDGGRRALRDVRSPGPLAVSAEVTHALVRILSHERDRTIDPAPKLSLEAVDALEDYLRARLPDDVLAIYAAAPKALVGFELGRVGQLSETAWEGGLRKARVVLGPWGKHLVCVPRRPEPGHALRVTFYDPEDQSESNPSSLVEWLDRVFESTLDQDDDDLEFLPDFEEDEPEEIAWVPQLERTIVLPVPGLEKAGLRVRHARFGEGVVLRALPESDKLEIDFGDLGIKVLVSRFVQELPAE